MESAGCPPTSILKASLLAAELLDCGRRELKGWANATAVALAGRMLALRDGASRLPVQIWFESNPAAQDQHFWRPIPPFIVEAKTLTSTNVRDGQVTKGRSPSAQPQTLRRVQVRDRSKGYRSLTHELNPEVLPTADVVALYGQRWRMEDADALVKRPRGLADVGCGTDNAIPLQLWATGLRYAVWLDRVDAIADRLQPPGAAISVERTDRSVYFATPALHRDATPDPIADLAGRVVDLGLFKGPRTSRPPVNLLEIVTDSSSKP